MRTLRRIERALIALTLIAFTLSALALILGVGAAQAEPVSYADTPTVVLTWRNEGVIHTLDQGDAQRPPVVHLAPGWSKLGPDALAGAVDDVARVVSPRPPLVVVRGPGGELRGRWTPRGGFERLD